MWLRDERGSGPGRLEEGRPRGGGAGQHSPLASIPGGGGDPDITRVSHGNQVRSRRQSLFHVSPEF